jgi:hypothetical protein
MTSDGGATTRNEADDNVSGEDPHGAWRQVEVEPCSGWRRRAAPVIGTMAVLLWRSDSKWHDRTSMVQSEAVRRKYLWH